MKIFIVVCILLPLLCSATSSYSSFWEYALEQERTLKSFEVGKIWSDCTKASDHGKIVDITITPNPPKKGSDLVINATVTVDEVVTSGKVNAIVMLGSLPYQKSYEICDLLKDVQISCPVPVGKISFGIKLKVPEYTPAGDYKGQAVATDQNNNRLFCVNLMLHMD